MVNVICKMDTFLFDIKLKTVRFSNVVQVRHLQEEEEDRKPKTDHLHFQRRIQKAEDMLKPILEKHINLVMKKNIYC